MIVKEDVVFVKQTFEKYRIDNLLGLKGKYHDAFVDWLCWSYRNTDSEIWVNSRFQRVSNFYVKSLIVLGGAFISSLRCKVKYRGFQTEQIDASIIAMPFCGNHIRFKYIYDFLGENVAVHYPPIFHYQFLDSHIDCFKQQGEKLALDCFKIRDIITVLWVLFKNRKELKDCHNEIDIFFSKSYGSLASVITTSLLYRCYFSRFLKKIANNGVIHKWLFDYDFDYKYIIFNNEIKIHRKNDITFHIQHGAFWGYNDAYCNPVSDVSICCCEREKHIIENYNKYGSKIFAQGSSWQSIDKTKNNAVCDLYLYDILVLLTDTSDERYTTYQKNILMDLSKTNEKVLVRYRPQSALLDKMILQEFTTGMVVSSGTSLKEDIMSSRIVACFSEDAVFECFRNNKKVCYFVLDVQNFDMNIAVSNNMFVMSPENYSSSCFRQSLDGGECDYSQDAFVRYNFGDFEFDRIKSNLNRILNWT